MTAVDFAQVAPVGASILGGVPATEIAAVRPDRPRRIEEIMPDVLARYGLKPDGETSAADRRRMARR